MEYTEKEHAERLLEMLSHNKPCDHCPGKDLPPEIACSACNSFLPGYDLDLINKTAIGTCPCHVLGQQEAIKRTWLALEAKGYI